jgi:hypothetical protein
MCSNNAHLCTNQAYGAIHKSQLLADLGALVEGDTHQQAATPLRRSNLM